MIGSRLRGTVAGAVLVLAGAAYVAAPLAFAAPAPGMTLGNTQPSSATLNGAVVVGPGGASTGYYTKLVVITAGSSLDLVNLDQLAHTVTSVARKPDGTPLFNGNALPGKTANVTGVGKLRPGTYEFYCQFHPNMTGQLVVEGKSSGAPTPSAPPTFPSKLRIPKVLTGSHLTIPVKEANVRVIPRGPKTQMWTFGGSYPGPTIVRPAGHPTTVTYVNHLPRPVGAITVHLHGDHHPSASDGQPASFLVKPGHRRTYHYPLTDHGRPEPAGFEFYHDHRMGKTGRNNWNGLQGMFEVTSKAERRLHLPSGRYDVPLMVVDRSFDSLNQLTEPYPTGTGGLLSAGAPPGDATVGNDILVNGRYRPHLDVATHRYRFRLLNSSGFQSYDFSLTGGMTFTQIGNGPGLLPSPVKRHDIILGPAQRADVVVNFRGRMHQRIQLRSIATKNAAAGGIGSPVAPIMQFRVDRRTADGSRVPRRLPSPPQIKAAANPTATWVFGLGASTSLHPYWTVNGAAYDPGKVQLSVPLGSTQTWELVNLSDITHYIHIHEEQWHTVSVNGKPPPAYMRGLMDTWRIDPGQSVEVAAKMTDYTGIFMIHCHMLDHEDHGMMAQFAVTRGGSKKLPAGYSYQTGPAMPAALAELPRPQALALATAAANRSTMTAGQMRAMDMGPPAGSGTGMAMDVDGPAPAWMTALVRGGWALSIELPGLALLLLWRRRRELGTPLRRGFAMLMLAGVAVTHASDWLDKLREAPYLAVGFGLLIAGSGACALALATWRKAAPIDQLGGWMAGLTMLGYFYSRSIGLPQIADHVGHWADPWGIASLCVELPLVLLAIPRRYVVNIWRAPVRRRAVAGVAAAAVASTLAAATVSSAAPPELRAPAATAGHHHHHHRVLLVCNGTRRCPHVKGVHYFKSLQLAIDRATNGSYILIWPGLYKQSATVQRTTNLTRRLHIRGMNRNGVVFDGRKTGGSAVHVLGVNKTWVENMTGQHYLKGSANAFYWTGVDGYWGNYLTAYDNGDYGVYAYDSTSSGKVPSTFAFDYGSWNADSGIYIGGCRECHAVITNSKAEHNPIGYSGTNAGGELYIINSEWAHNASGIVPNTLTSEPDPPQSGAFIAGNYVHDNNATNTPGSGITAIAPVGDGIEIAGGSDNVIRANRIVNQLHDGVVTHWLYTPPMNNQVVYNTFKHVGYGRGPADADVAFDGTGIQNCQDHNVDITGGRRHPATVNPTDVDNLSRCGDANPGRKDGRGIYLPGSPLVSIITALDAVGITDKKDYRGPGPHPEAQKTMPNPCKGLPKNPWCRSGKPRFRIPTRP